MLLEALLEEHASQPAWVTLLFEILKLTVPALTVGWVLGRQIKHDRESEERRRETERENERRDVRRRAYSEWIAALEAFRNWHIGKLVRPPEGPILEEWRRDIRRVYTDLSAKTYQLRICEPNSELRARIEHIVEMVKSIPTDVDDKVYRAKAKESIARIDALFRDLTISGDLY